MGRFSKWSYDFKGKSVLITGGSGSFGTKLVETLLKGHNPRRIIVYSRGELRQWEMQQEFGYEKYPNMRYFIGDVRDRERLTMACRDVDVIVHAAALKQVPAAEYNPMECLHTNIWGAENVVHAAMAQNVKHVIALSSDKAVNPINLYGASKLASDKIFVAANNISGANGTRYSVVRYGNVIGSRGSVIPYFRKCIAEGAAHLPITDPRMTRFWITLQQGVNFAMSCLKVMQGGEIFVAKLPSMKMPDLATAMAPRLPQKIVGIRPGEKLHEIMVSSDDARQTIELEDRYVIMPSFQFWSKDTPTYKNSRPVADGFVYSSDNNTEWLNPEQIRDLINTSLPEDQ